MPVAFSLDSCVTVGAETVVVVGAGVTAEEVGPIPVDASERAGFSARRPIVIAGSRTAIQRGRAIPRLSGHSVTATPG
jgi:hypothetical protein